MMKSALALAVGVALAAGTAFAQQYRWTDQNGRIHYTDTPPPPSAKDVRKKGTPPPPAGTPVVPFDLEKAQRDAPVTLYSHPTCTDSCTFARDLLNRRGVPFKEVVVGTTKQLEELKAISGGSEVPVLTVGKRVEKVASEAAYGAALDAAGYPKQGILPPGKQAAPSVKAESLETAGPEPKPAAKPEAPPAPLGPYAPGAPAPKPAAKPAAKSQ